MNAAGQRGGISSLFVRGGESTYNKVIVDGVAVDTPGQTFDFGTLPLAEADRLEFVRGAQSTLYGSDAMTSVIQVWTRTGSTPIPELRLAADGGNFGTANGNASLSGAYRRFDYNAFANQFNTNGQGINNHYSDALQGANVGMAITDQVALRVRVRHSNSYTGVPGEWSFNGYDPAGESGWCNVLSAAARSERILAPEQSSGQRGTRHPRSIWLAASVNRLRLSLPLQRHQSGRRRCSRGWIWFPVRLSLPRIRSHQSRRI